MVTMLRANIVAAIMLCVPIMSVEADEPSEIETNQGSLVRPGEQEREVLPEQDKYRSYFGVAIQELSPAFAEHLPGLVKRDQGLIVTHIASDSPAEAAGLKPHDILLSYDDQRLMHPEQLRRLLANDEPGRVVDLSIVRKAKPATIKVKLGKQFVHPSERGDLAETHNETDEREIALSRRGFSYDASALLRRGYNPNVIGGNGGYSRAAQFGNHSDSVGGQMSFDALPHPRLFDYQSPTYYGYQRSSTYTGMHSTRFW